MSRNLYKELRKSIYLLHVDAGSCNGCDIEVLDALTPYFDIERFGMKLVASPKQADAVIVTGPVTRQFKRFLKRIYEYLPKPTAVVAVGSCACGGGIWHDTYNVIGGVDKVIPVDVYVPGCPPRPSAIIHGVLVALGVIEQKVKRVERSLGLKGFRTLEVRKKGMVEGYSTYRKVVLELKRMIGYRLTYRLLKDYVELMRRSSYRDELLKGIEDIVRAWGEDPRIREALETMARRIGKDDG